jgi:hypothetical protein
MSSSRQQTMKRQKNLFLFEDTTVDKIIEAEFEGKFVWIKVNFIILGNKTQNDREKWNTMSRPKICKYHYYQ